MPLQVLQSIFFLPVHVIQLPVPLQVIHLTFSFLGGATGGGGGGGALVLPGWVVTVLVPPVPLQAEHFPEPIQTSHQTLPLPLQILHALPSTFPFQQYSVEEKDLGHFLKLLPLQK